MCPPLRVGGRDGPLLLPDHSSHSPSHNSDDYHNPQINTLTLSQSGVTTRNCLLRQLHGACCVALLLLGCWVGRGAGYDPRSWRWLTATATAGGRSSQCGRRTEEGGREGGLCNSKTKHRAACCQNHCCLEVTFVYKNLAYVCLSGRWEPHIFHKSEVERWSSCCLAKRLRDTFLPKLVPTTNK